MWAWLIPVARALHHPIAFIIIVCLALACWVAAAVFLLRARAITQLSRSAEKQRLQNRSYSFATAFFVLIMIGIGEMALVTAASIAQFAPILASTIGSVSIDGREVSTPDHLISAIRAMHSVPAHHSHPQDPGFTVTVSTQRGPLTFVLKRDSDDPREYWTFYSGLDGWPVEVGRVTTDQLDGR
jgi:hypothetical protein